MSDATIEREITDVGVECFGDPQSVHYEERREGVVAWGADPGLDEKSAKFGAIRAEGS